MGTQADSAAAVLVRGVAEQTGNALPRMQFRILSYLIEHGYCPPRGLPRSNFRTLAVHYGRSESLVRHAMGALVEKGAVIRWADEAQMSRFSFNPDWRPEPRKPSP